MQCQIVQVSTLTGVLDIKWQPEEEGIADQFRKEQSNSKFHYSLHKWRINKPDVATHLVT